MKIIHLADLVSYNANSRGTRTGDCSVRSISLAFNRSYNDIKKLLNSAMEYTHSRKYNYTKNIVYVIKDILGAGNYTDIAAEKLTVQAFADAHKSGTYLVGCNNKPNPAPNASPPTNFPNPDFLLIFIFLHFFNFLLEKFSKYTSY